MDMPMENQDFEVDLNYITSCEQASRSRSEYDYRMEYESLVTSMLGHEGIYLFEEDITDRYYNLSLKEILDQNDNYVQGPNRRNPKMDEKLCPTYYDTCMSLYITPMNRSYPSFLAYLLKNIDLLKIDQCLSYQLEKYHGNDFASFSRLLSLIIRKYEGVIIPEKVITTIQEWITSRSENRKNEQADATDSNLSGKKRGRINRRAEDNITVLNREQTILFIQYLKESGVFLKDEYLTDADAGKAFELLTGYSQHTLRQDLGKYYQFQDRENLKKLHQAFSAITGNIDRLLKNL
jgi:hypothetical protein